MSRSPRSRRYVPSPVASARGIDDTESPAGTESGARASPSRTPSTSPTSGWSNGSHRAASSPDSEERRQRPRGASRRASTSEPFPSSPTTRCTLPRRVSIARTAARAASSRSGRTAPSGGVGSSARTRRERRSDPTGSLSRCSPVAPAAVANDCPRSTGPTGRVRRSAATTATTCPRPSPETRWWSAARLPTTAGSSPPTRSTANGAGRAGWRFRLGISRRSPTACTP